MKGYVCPLYILPFDHRSTFAKKLLDLGYPVKEGDKSQVTRYKKIVFEAFQLAMKKSNCSPCMGMLVDEEFGGPIITAAKKKQYNYAVPVEKSGQTVFNFEFGNKFGEHIDKNSPVFVKALVRYNPSNRSDNKIQLRRLKRLNDFCEKNGYRFMLEPLVPPTKAQLKQMKGDQRKFDKKLKPGLTVRMVQEIHKAGIDPDVWKVEAVESKKAWSEIAGTIRNNHSRRAVNIIVLGRGENTKLVDKWIKTAASTGLVNGFAVGRTIFFKSLEQYRDHEIKRAEAVEQIADNYLRMINQWRKNAKVKHSCVCPM